MSRQYPLTNREEIEIKKIIEKYIQSYYGDLYKDNEVVITFREDDGTAYIQIN